MFCSVCLPGHWGDAISKFANPDRYTGSREFAILTAKGCQHFSICAP